jgi:cystathionine beta-lyase/cystathionine gamma-synthase
MQGMSGLLTFCVESFDVAEKVINKLQLFGIGVSWGGFESLVMSPCIPMGKQNIASSIKNTQYEEGMIRISIGLEDVEDLIADLDNALSTI